MIAYLTIDLLTDESGSVVAEGWPSPIPLVYRRPRAVSVVVRTVVVRTVPSRPAYIPPGADRRAIKAHNIRKQWGY